MWPRLEVLAAVLLAERAPADVADVKQYVTAVPARRDLVRVIRDVAYAAVLKIAAFVSFNTAIILCTPAAVVAVQTSLQTSLLRAISVSAIIAFNP